MIGKVIKIYENNVIVELVLDDSQKKSIMNFHVAFDTDTSKIIGEIVSIDKSTATVNLLGELKNNRFIPGLSKKPFFGEPCRIITKE